MTTQTLTVSIESPSLLESSSRKDADDWIKKLTKAEELFIMRQFEDSLVVCIESLSKISQTSNEAQDNSSSSKIKYILDRLASLHHNCNTSIQSNDRDVMQCECVPFIAIVVQSLLEWEKDEDRSFAIDNLTSTLQSFYGSLEKIPFSILFLTLNGLASGGRFKEAQDIITTCLESANNSTSLYETEQYESLVQLYIFHVLPALGKWEDAFQFLEKDRRLPQWHKEAFKKHLSTKQQDALSKISSSTLSTSQSSLSTSNTPTKSPSLSEKKKDQTKKVPTKETVPINKQPVVAPKRDHPVLAHFKKYYPIWGLIGFVAFVFTLLQRYRGSTSSNDKKKKIVRRQNDSSWFSGIFDIFSSLVASPVARYR